MKIIKMPPLKANPITCIRCNCVYQYAEKDIDWRGKFGNMSAYVQCPYCNQCVNIDNFNKEKTDE